MITSTGGTITVSRPGQPLDGLTLTLPAGSVTGPVSVTLSVVSTVGVTLVSGMKATSAGLQISAAAGALSSPAIVRFPSSTALDENAVLVAYNQRTGESTVLPQQVPGETGVSALLPALDASFIPTASGASPSSGWFSARRLEEDVLIFLSGVPPEAQTRNVDTGFQAGRDNWDFTNFAVAWLPFLPGAVEEDRMTRVIDMSSGMVATSLWYFKNQRGAQPLHDRFRLQGNQEYSNKVGIRWASLANDDTRVDLEIPIKGIKALFSEDEELTPPHLFNWGQFNLLKKIFWENGDRPIPIILYEVEDLLNHPDDQELEGEMAIAVGIVGNKLLIVPAIDDITLELTFTEEGGLQPEELIYHDLSRFTVRSFVPASERSLLSRPAVAANWPKVLDETVGKAEGWPEPELHWAGGKLDPKRVFLADTLTMWWECPGCPDFNIRPPGTPDAAENPVPFNYGRIVNGSMDALPRQVVRGRTRWSADSVASDVEPTRTGHYLVLFQADTEVAGRYAGGWLDWQTVEFRKVSLHPAPDEVEPTSDTTVTFTLAPSQPLPAGTTFSWVLRTSDGRDSVATTGPTHTRDIEAGTDGMLLITAHEKDSKRPIARDSVAVKSGEMAAFWRITTIADSDNLLENADPGEGGEIFDLLTRALAAPGAAAIAVNGTLPNASLLLRVLPSATWTRDNCCEANTLPGELRQLLGVMPPVSAGVGPYFVGWEQSQWSQTSTDITTGTVTGQYIMGTMPYDIEDVGTQVGPKGAVRISATRNGKIMTGNIAFTIWFVDNETGKLDDVDTFLFPFTAERIR
jgi:hypothetical protein